MNKQSKSEGKIELEIAGTQKMIKLLTGLAKGTLKYKHLLMGDEKAILRYIRRFEVIGFIVKE